MKKSKFTLVIVLGLVLCLLCGTTTTFSWFNRPGSISGDSLTYSDSYNVTNGKDITAVTYVASKPDGSEYSANPFDFKSLQTVSAHETRYFCTEVKNTGTAPQSISLFLRNSETNKLSVGVNSPLRTYRRVTSDSQTSGVSRTPCNVNKKNVYVGFVTADSLPENLKADRNSLNPGDYFLHCWNDKGAVEAGVNNSFLKKDVEYTLTTPAYANFRANYDISYCTIPYNYNNVKINGIKMYKKLEYNGKEWCDGSDNYDVDTNNTVLGFYWNGSKKLTAANEQTKVNGVLAKAAGISSFYSKAEAVVDNTLDLKATAQGTVTYTSSKTDVATVDGKGLVTTKKAGKTTITVTSTGAYGDVITAKCELTVSKKPVKSSYIPIVTNMKIEGKTDNDPVVTKVYWYIKNDTASEATYSLGDVQISL